MGILFQVYWMTSMQLYGLFLLSFTLPVVGVAMAILPSALIPRSSSLGSIPSQDTVTSQT